MPDGVRLSTRMWLPLGANSRPVPAILEYIPYRKTDMVRPRDERNHPYLAANGFACLRVDMRGSGDSEGQMSDMYETAELSDARHVIEWIAAQPWCNGAVGMFGTSWGGTASLQANIDAPEALKAVIAVCATQDRYENDIHHSGGCLLTDSIEWGATFPAILGSPPTSAPYGPGWHAIWRDRLEQLSFPLERWVREERRGDYWRHGSVNYQHDRLSRPILAIGGWSDRYSDSVMSLVDSRPDITWGIVGPWGHHYPDQGHPGPAIGFQKLMLDWWTRWLVPDRPKDPDWPRLRVWLCEFDPPGDVIGERNGRWIESAQPASETTERRWYLDEAGLAPTRGTASGPWPIPYDLGIGAASGDTGYFGRYGGQPLDRRADDANSLTFDTPPLTNDVVLYGDAEVELMISASDPISQISVRINDVAPDGTSAQVVLAFRNLALDDDLDNPIDLPGISQRRVRVRFPKRAYRFRQGHRIRLAFASSCWPTVWPSPHRTQINVGPGTLTLSEFKGVAHDLQDPFPSSPGACTTGKRAEVIRSPLIKRFARTEPDGVVTSGWHQRPCMWRFPATRSVFGYETRAEHRIDPADPLSAHSQFKHTMTFERPDGTINVSCQVTMTCDKGNFHISGDLHAHLDGSEIAHRSWRTVVPRRYS